MVFLRRPGNQAQFSAQLAGQPPYDAGSPGRAPAEIVRSMRARSRFLLASRPG